MGSPSAFTTRPSHAADGRTAPATDVTSARQPRRTPSSGANGMSNAYGPENPMTSLGIFLPGASITTRAPTDIACSGGNLDHQTAHADDAAINLDAVEFVNLFGERLHGATGFCVRSVTCNAPVLTLCLPAPLIIALVLGKERFAKP